MLLNSNQEISSRLLFPNSRLLLSAGTITKAKFTDRVSAEKNSGFDAISLFPQLYLDVRYKEKLSIGDMNTILDDNGIHLDEVDPLLDWYGPSISQSESLLYEMADAFNVRSMNAATAFAPKLQLEEMCLAFSRVCERAAQHGLRVDLEFLPWTIVPNLSSALKIIEASGQNNCGVMFDCWHFYRSGGDSEDIHSLTEKQCRLITSIQVCDAPAIPTPLSWKHKLIAGKEMLVNLLDEKRVLGKHFMKVASKACNTHPDAFSMMNEAICSRLMPGEGDIPLLPILNALQSGGCKPTIGLEVFSLGHNNLPAEQVVKQVKTAWQKLANS